MTVTVLLGQADCVVLRLAARLHRRRSLNPLPEYRVLADAEGFVIQVEEHWLSERPLTLKDLQLEQQECARAGIRLGLETF